MSAGPLWRNGASGYLTCSVDAFSLSPVYVTAASARRLLRSGEDVVLPEGYSLDTLGNITWLTGAYGAEVRVSERQGREIAQLARELIDRHAGKLEPAELEGARHVIEIIVDNTKH